MIKKVELRVKPSQADDMKLIENLIRRQSNFEKGERFEYQLKRRSVDARGKNPKIVLGFDVYISEKSPEIPAVVKNYKSVESARSVHIIGAGPAGYFAALELIELGIKPIIFERGKNVRERRRDLRAIQQEGIVHPNSNYCFGEGGAGTYSDGKLYTRSIKRGNHIKVLKLLVEHGAKSDIMIDAHPHIGSNKLPGIVSNLRETILKHGGEVHFNSKVSDIKIHKGKVTKIHLEDGRKFDVSALILATGHSARDIHEILSQLGVELEFKPFALGVRIEHPQSLIDEIQYGLSQRGPHLPAAAYSLACTIKDRGVFSFCMCPGGLIIPAATAPGELVTNGMSLSRRDSAFSNAGVVTAIEYKDLSRLSFKGVYAGVQFQAKVEQSLFQAGDGSQMLPAQKLTDFMAARPSDAVNQSSYIPGVYPGRLHELLPSFVYDRLRYGISIFERKMKGYITDKANVVAPESRTSSPIKIPRDPKTRMNPQIQGLYPCGEGAGYAGGILSAAMDGQNVARSVAEMILV